MNYDQFLKDLPRIPAMTIDQVCRYYGGQPEVVRRLLRSLQASGSVVLTTELIRDRIATAPIAVIKPGGPSLPAGEIAYRAQQLWSDRFSPKLIIRATSKLSPANR